MSFEKGRPLTDIELLRELEPTVAANLDRHLGMAQEWLPHEWVPWSRGRDFTGETGLAWAPEQSHVREAVRAVWQSFLGGRGETWSRPWALVALNAWMKTTGVSA